MSVVCAGDLPPLRALSFRPAIGFLLPDWLLKCAKTFILILCYLSFWISDRAEAAEFGNLNKERLSGGENLFYLGKETLWAACSAVPRHTRQVVGASVEAVAVPGVLPSGEIAWSWLHLLLAQKYCVMSGWLLNCYECSFSITVVWEIKLPISQAHCRVLISQQRSSCWKTLDWKKLRNAKYCKYFISLYLNIGVTRTPKSVKCFWNIPK